MEPPIEMTTFTESPKFPRNRTISGSSSNSYDGESSPDKDSEKHLNTSFPHTNESPLSYMSTDSGTNSPSMLLKTSKQSKHNKTVDIRSSRGGQFSVAPKDASLLGRIAHKAPKKPRVLEPHEVFVELEELQSDSTSNLEWKETARWIKFEEDVEQEVGRWGRPHVSALAFHSLVDLRKGLDNGCILLDVEGCNFPAIVDKIVEQLVDRGHLAEDKVDYVVQALYKKHKHQHHVTLWEEFKQAAKSADGKLHDLGDQLRHRYHHHSTSAQPVHKLVEDPSTSFEVELSMVSDEEDKSENFVKVVHSSSTSINMSSDNKLSRSTQELLEKIPDGAESLTVLVGGVSFLSEPLVVFVRLHQSHLLGDLTEVPIPVRFIFLTLGPRQKMDYHEIGRAMATLMSDKHFHDMAYLSSSREELVDAIDHFLDDSLVLPPGDWDQELILPLMHERNELRKRKEKKSPDHVEDETAIKFSCKPCGGMIHDVKNLIKRYPSDIKDMLHIQPFIAIIFIYISCIAPAIAFGGLMEEITSNSIGETETLVGTGLSGIVQGLFSVQPLAILAFTGPLLLFEEIIIEFAHLLHIEYLPWRACIGLWVMIVVLIFALSESTFLVKNFTRFSEEIFTFVIAIFFIVEVFRTIIKIFHRNPICGVVYPCGNYAQCTNTCDCSNMTALWNDSESGDIYNNQSYDELRLPHAFNVCNQVNAALWAVFLCIGVFMIAVLLRKFRHSRFLGKQLRRLVSDFGMLAALATMVELAYFLRNTIAVEVLVVPDGWKPSNSTARGWVINPVENLEVYHIIGAIVPAILLAILIFIENQLTLFLINKPEHKLKKGVGYHYDLCIVAVLAGVCGVLGLPWHCAAPIRSIQHLQSLSYYSRKTAPGEKPTLKGVHEQRITNIAVHILIVLSPFAYPILREIPFACLMGVFLYLAFASLSGIQLRKRLKLLFMPPKHHPDLSYVRKVRTWKMNIYTLIQLMLVGILLGIKFSPAGMFYPLAIVLLVPIKMLLGKYVFTHVEMEALDSEEDFPDMIDDDFAEYQATHVPY